MGSHGSGRKILWTSATLATRESVGIIHCPPLVEELLTEGTN